jgi:hypothetical protein
MSTRAVRLDSELLDRIAEVAQRNRRTVPAEITVMIEAMLKVDKNTEGVRNVAPEPA